MRTYLTLRPLALVLLVVLAACQPEQAPLPTLIAVDTTPTADAAAGTTTPAAPSADVERRLPTLPPTWTPSPAPTEPPPPVTNPTVTPVVAQGTIFFIFNADSIAALKADGSSEKLILVGGAPADLTLAPDGKFLAYTAQGAGSAREVFVTVPDGSYVQKVSCLGFARVLSPVWSADGQTLAFAGSQEPNGPLGIYRAAVIGSGQCPSGNNQQLLAQTELATVSDMAWSPDGTRIYVSSRAIYAVDAVAGGLSAALTIPSGFGPDTGVIPSPDGGRLYLLKTERDERTRQIGGTLYQADVASLQTLPLREFRSTPFFARAIRLSRDGRYLLAATDRDISVQNMTTNFANQIVQGGNFFPQPIFNPAADTVAFVDGGAGAITVQQIYLVSRDGANRRQISFHQEGTITNLNWSAE